MIQRFVIGKPFPTESVVLDLPAETGPVPYLTPDGDGWQYVMQEKDIVYGLGEMPRGLNKRGWHYETNNTDESEHGENRLSYYAAHNFLLISPADGSGCIGIFVDFPGKVSYDIGYTRHDTLRFATAEPNYALYLITAPAAAEVAKEFRQLIGPSYIPPKWAFGLAQSRFGYKTEADIREVAAQYKANDLPLDMICMDIDYMQSYADFTIDKARFPDLGKLAADLKAKGIRLVPIIDAGIRCDDNDPVCREGLEKGYFCTKEDGSPFVAAVWPGKALFPDMLNKEARDWFGEQYKFLLDQGVEGFWNDMNEPAIFYTEDRLKEVLDKIDDYKDRNLDMNDFGEMTALVGSLSNNTEDYTRFYHNIQGEKVSHDRVHNLFGYNMTRAAGEAFERLEPDKRILMFSRSSYIGMHRYGGIWMGDNKSWWSHILLNLHMLPSLNMCGFLYTGADLGGFGADTTEDLMLRWLALGIFTPLMRNHSALGTRRQEAYQFENMDGFRHIIGLRYRLLPYLYSEYMKAVLNDEMMFRPLAFDYPDDRHAKAVEDQLLLGDGMMIAPVYEQNADGRYVYLPESMKQVRFSADGTVEETILPAGHHFVEIPLTDVVLFIRPNHLIPLSKGGQCVDEVDFEALTFLSYVTEGNEAVYTYYHDDGYEKDYENPAHLSEIRISSDGTVTK